MGEIFNDMWFVRVIVVNRLFLRDWMWSVNNNFDVVCYYGIIF